MVEYSEDNRLAITVEDAALFATAEGAAAFLGRAGGTRFDQLVKAARRG